MPLVPTTKYDIPVILFNNQIFTSWVAKTSVIPQLNLNTFWYFNKKETTTEDLLTWLRLLNVIFVNWRIFKMSQKDAQTWASVGLSVCLAPSTAAPSDGRVNNKSKHKRV